MTHGENLCTWQRICADAFIWDDGWLVFADQHSQFGTLSVKHVAVQFRRRPPRARYSIEPPLQTAPKGMAT